ncbi:MAG: GNAT family N-acetyltransferase, partial [Gammaproteobacteria bacterium]|nr:GNAT family N-acetyltransferase [Gammaproteobacteria bacterium]
KIPESPLFAEERVQGLFKPYETKPVEGLTQEKDLLNEAKSLTKDVKKEEKQNTIVVGDNKTGIMVLNRNKFNPIIKDGKEYLRIDDVRVPEGLRQKGVATKLYKEALQEAKKKGYGGIVSDSKRVEDNTGAIKKIHDKFLTNKGKYEIDLGSKERSVTFIEDVKSPPQGKGSIEAKTKPVSSPKDFVGKKWMSDEGKREVVDYTDYKGEKVYLVSNERTDALEIVRPSELENVIKVDQINKTSRDKSEKVRQEEVAEQQKQKELENDLLGFEKGKTGLELGRTSKILNRDVRYENKSAKRKDMIADLVNRDYEITNENILRKKGDIAGYQLNKTEGDFARFLIDKKPKAELPSGETVKKPSEKVVPKIKRSYDAFKSNKAPKESYIDGRGNERSYYGDEAYKEYMDKSDETGKRIRWAVELSDGRKVSVDGAIRLTNPKLWERIKNKKGRAKTEALYEGLSKPEKDSFVTEAIEGIEFDGYNDVQIEKKLSEAQHPFANVQKFRKKVSENLTDSKGNFSQAETVKATSVKEPHDKFIFRTDKNNKEYLEPIREQDVVKTLKINDREVFAHKMSTGYYNVTDTKTGVSITNNTTGFKTPEMAIRNAKKMVGGADPKFLQNRLNDFERRVNTLLKSSSKIEEKQPTSAKEPWEMNMSELQKFYDDYNKKNENPEYAPTDYEIKTMKEIKRLSKKPIDEIYPDIENAAKLRRKYNNADKWAGLYRKALSEGKPVPEEVLKDYPELTKTVKTESVTEKVTPKTIEKESEKVIDEAVETAKEDFVPMKEQKAYLLEEIEKVIKDAPKKK